MKRLHGLGIQLLVGTTADTFILVAASGGEPLLVEGVEAPEPTDPPLML